MKENTIIWLIVGAVALYVLSQQSQTNSVQNSINSASTALNNAMSQLGEYS